MTRTTLKDFFMAHEPTVPNIMDAIMKKAGHRMVGSAAIIPGTDNVAEYAAWCTKCGTHVNGRTRHTGSTQYGFPLNLMIVCPNCGEMELVRKNHSVNLNRLYYMEKITAPADLTKKPVDGEIIAFHKLYYSVTYDEGAHVTLHRYSDSVYALKGVGIYEVSKRIRRVTPVNALFPRFYWWEDTLLVFDAELKDFAAQFSKPAGDFHIADQDALESIMREYVRPVQTGKSVFRKYTDFEFPKIDVQPYIDNTINKISESDRNGPCTGFGFSLSAVDSKKNLIIRHYYGTLHYGELVRFEEDARTIVGPDFTIEYINNGFVWKKGKYPSYTMNRLVLDEFIDAVKQSCFAEAEPSIAEIQNRSVGSGLVLDFLQAYMAYPAMKVLADAGLYHTVVTCIGKNIDPSFLFLNPSAPTIHKKFGLSPELFECVKNLAESDEYGDYTLYRHCAKLASLDPTFTIDQIKRLFDLFREHGIVYESTRQEICKPLFSVIGGPVKTRDAVQYIKRVVESQCIKMESAVSLWKDYLSLLLSVEKEPTQKQLYPPALKLALDRLYAACGYRNTRERRYIANFASQDWFDDSLGSYRFEFVDAQKDPRAMRLLSHDWLYRNKPAAFVFVSDTHDTHAKPIVLIALKSDTGVELAIDEDGCVIFEAFEKDEAYKAAKPMIKEYCRYKGIEIVSRWTLPWV